MSQDILFGAIAATEGFVPADTVTTALARQKSGDARRIGEILVEMKALDLEGVQTILSIQRLEVADRIENPTSGGLFGQIAVRLRACNESQLAECARRQTELAATGKPIRIGQLMLQAGCLSHEQFAEVLRQQEKYPVRCAGCARWWFVDGLGEGTKVFCPACARLVPIPLLEGSNSAIAEFVQREAFGQATVRVSGASAELFGAYRVDTELQRTTGSAYFRAVHAPSKRLVSLRLLQATRVATPAELAAFRGRATQLAALTHPNIATIVEAGDVDGRAYIANEMHDGAPISAILAKRLRTQADLLRFLEATARAVAHAHANLVTHGSLRPALILVGHGFQPRILEAGHAQLVAMLPGLKPDPPPLTSCTPPEVVAGDAPTPAADIYALGALLYEIVGGRRPHDRRGVRLRELIEAGPPDPLPDGVAADWRQMVARAMARRPGDRYPHATAFADDLHSALEGKPLKPTGFFRWLFGR